MRNGILSVCYAVTFIFNSCYSIKILGLFPLPIKSHFIFYEKYIKELVNRGNEVYVVSHFPRSKPMPNYYDIAINGSLPDSVSKISIQTKINRGSLGKAKYIYRTCGSDICEYLFKFPAIVNLKQANLTFDLIIAEIYGTDCLIGFAHHFHVPIIGISGTDLLPWAASRMGNPDNPAHLPNYFLATKEKMDLGEKMLAFTALLLTKIGYFFLSTVSSEMKAREFFGFDTPSLETLVTNTSIILVNSHLSVNIPRAMVPGIVEVGGLHIETPNPVSKNVDKIIKLSEKGVIYFSMGSVIDMGTFPKHILQDILDVFKDMPYNFIFSGNITDVEIPGNVYVITWVEQIELLCDERLKLFITHGGLLSMQEAAYCAVPILGLPMFPNLERNVNRYACNGAGLSIYFEDFTKEIFSETINILLSDNTYKKNAEKISEIFRERPMSAMDTAIYWTEYVMTFGGARHLKTRSSDLIWYEYYLIDCLLVTLLATMMFVGIIFLIVKIVQNVDDAWLYRLGRKRSDDDEYETDKDK